MSSSPRSLKRPQTFVSTPSKSHRKEADDSPNRASGDDYVLVSSGANDLDNSITGVTCDRFKGECANNRNLQREKYTPESRKIEETNVSPDSVAYEKIANSLFVGTNDQHDSLNEDVGVTQSQLVNQILDFYNILLLAFQQAQV